MSFANPFGLWGLLSLPVILGLHLLHEQHRRTVVSDLALWAFLETEAYRPRLRRLPITRLLVIDLLVGLVLSLAWAQPSVSAAFPGAGSRQMVILLDVSSSMRAGDGISTRFAQAVGQIQDLLVASRPGDVATVIVFGGGVRLVGDSRTDGLAQLSARVAEIKPGETGSDLPGALALGKAQVDEQLPAEFHIFSDGDFPLEGDSNLAELGYPLHWHWMGSSPGNQAVIELNATRLGNGSVQIFARIANFSPVPVSRRMTLLINGEARDQPMLNLPAEASVPSVWQIPEGDVGQPVTALVRLEGSDPLPEDDQATLAVQPLRMVRVALVVDDPGALQQAIRAVPATELRVIAPADYAATLSETGPAAFDLTVFRGFLPELWPEGAVLVADPPTQGDFPGPHGSGSLVAAGRREIPAGAFVQVPQPNPIVDGIDFSGVRWARAWALDKASNGLTLLLQAGEAPLIVWGQWDAGQPGPTSLTVLLADLSAGNFTRQAAFPIWIANLVENARQNPEQAVIRTGDDLWLPAQDGRTQAIQVIAPGQEAANLVDDWPEQWTDTLEPGLYRVRITALDGSTSEVVTGILAGEEQESDLRRRDWTETASQGSPAGLPAPQIQERRIDLLPWLLGTAILFLLGEAWLAWRN
ncbi:MAG: VWA domain-containing protein [Chloroflexi bacterium]|nr:VWA domain-containing protein [Chloroflexota bacterium]